MQQWTVTHILRLFLLLALLMGSGSSNANEYYPEDGCLSGDNLSNCSEIQLGTTGGDTSAQSWDIFSAMSDTLTSVRDSVLYNTYKTLQGAYNKTTEFVEDVVGAIDNFTERVRLVFREEFNSYLELFWGALFGNNPESDSVFWKFTRPIYDGILAFGLIIFCVILSYVIGIFSNNIFSAFTFILTFNSAVVVAYNLLGPEYTWYIISFIWVYPYISAVFICILFVCGSVFSFYESKRKVDMMMSMDTLLQKMEKLQQKMEKQQQKIEEQQKGMEEQPKMEEQQKRMEKQMKEQQPETEEQQKQMEKQQPETEEQQKQMEEEQPETEEQQKQMEEQQPETEEQQKQMDEQQPETEEQQKPMEEQQQETEEQELQQEKRMEEQQQKIGET